MPSVDYDPQRDVDVDLFAVLGTEWGADPDTVRRAWRRASREAHPDAGGTHEAFIAMQHAWEVLSDPAKRTRYVRAHEARHGPQSGRPGSRERGGSRSTGGGARSGSGGGAGARRAGRARAASRGSRAGPAPRCAGTTREGMPCGNPAAPGSDRCRFHDRGFDTRRSSTRRDPAGPRPRSIAWRCAEFVTFQGARLPCQYNHLIGEDRCWDHVGDAQRRAAIARAGQWRCAAVTKAGRPCRNPRSSLVYPLCDTHLTVGVFETYPRDRSGGRGRRPTDAHAAPPPPRNPPPRAAGPTPGAASPPPGPSTGGAGPVGEVPCAYCGRPSTLPVLGRSWCASCGRVSAGRDQGASNRQAGRDAPPRAHRQQPTGAAPGRGARTGPGPHAGPSRGTPSPPRRSTPHPRHRHHVAAAVAATLCMCLVAAGIVGAVNRWSRPRSLSFSEDIKATSARCESDGPLEAQDVAVGFDLRCTMRDSAPGNTDRPYVQVRLEGCDDWQRLDHDDSADPVTVTTRLNPCAGGPDSVQWQVCQTHGGPLPDDCVDGSTDLPPT